MPMKIFTKAFLKRDQLEQRTKLGTDGIEVYLRATDLERPDFRDDLKYCSDNFGTVNLETGDRLYGTRPTDLLDAESRKYVERVLEERSRISNAGVLVVHLAGRCQVLDPPYAGLVEPNKEEALELCIQYVYGLDPKNDIIALENTFPTDWMDENTGRLSFYRSGKISLDFKHRIRTFDTGHSGITVFTYRNLECDPTGVALLDCFDYASIRDDKFGKIPVYYGPDEHDLNAEKGDLTGIVCNEIKRAKVVNVHLNGSKGLLDGFGIDEESDIDLGQIVDTLIQKEKEGGREITLVTEVKERTTGDYLNVPNQVKMIKWLRERISRAT